MTERPAAHLPDARIPAADVAAATGPGSAALIPAAGSDFAAALAAGPVTNLRRIGGEMFAWSDRDARRGPARPRGALLRHLLIELATPGAAVLVAGPHHDDLVTALTDSGANVSWLLRSLRDAEEAARAHPAVTVLAGSAVKLDPAARFDVVIAADGVDRLNSTEGEQLSAADLIDRLAGVVHPDGALLLVHDNRFGLHHTVRLESGARHARDSAWYPEDEHDPYRPASVRQLTAGLSEAGLTVDVAYAVFAEPAAPTVLVGPGLLGEVSSPLRPRLRTALSQSFAAAFRNRPVLSDPRRLAARALAAGAEEAVAPAWLVIAGATRTERHALLVGDPTGTFAYAVADGGTTVLRPLGEPAERAGLRRVAAAPPATPAPNGYVLAERLLHLAATADLRGLRAELTRYDAWLRAWAIDATVSGPPALAGFDDILVTDDGPVLLPARWEPVEPVPVDVAAVRAAWYFAVQLITSGQPHPWPVTSSAVDLTAVLLGMVGRPVGADEVRSAAELQVAMATADADLTPAEQHDLLLGLLAVTPGSAPVDVTGYRELTEALWRQRYEASHLLAQMEWTEQIIRSRDGALSKLDWEIQFYRKSWAGRVLWLGRSAYRLARRDGGKALRRLRRGGYARPGR